MQGDCSPETSRMDGELLRAVWIEHERNGMVTSSYDSRTSMVDLCVLDLPKVEEVQYLLGMPLVLVRRMERWVPFVLVDPEKSSGMVHVKLDGTVQQPLPLTTVYHKLVPVEQNSYTLFQTIVGNGYPIALLDEEKILPIGKELTAIGLCRVNNRGVEITSCPEIPFFLSDLTKGEMEAEMSSRARAFFWITVALGTVSVGLLGHAIYRFWERVKRHREAREAQERFHQGDNEDDDPVENGSGDDEPGEMGDGQLCVICLRKRRKAAFVPCGHLVCCCNCAKRVILMDEQLCPVCRQDIDHMLRVYDS